MSSVKLKRKQQQVKDEQTHPDQSLPTMLLAGEADVRSLWPVVLLAGLTWVLSLPLFAPWSFWPLGYVVFVPWLLAIAVSGDPAPREVRETGAVRRWVLKTGGWGRRRWLYVVSYLLGGGFYLLHFRWLYDTTGPGYALASLLYVAPLFPLVAWGVRHLHRKRGLSLAVAFPLMWTLQELIHSRGPLAFPWFLLGHSQIRFPSVIQVADLAGVYGVSFVVAAVNGWLADLALRQFKRKRRQPAPDLRRFQVATAFALGLWLCAILYGQFRLHQGGQVEGPRVSVLQGDFPLSTSPEEKGPSDGKKAQAYMELARSALADAPDMVVFPETPWTMYLNKESLANPVLAKSGWLPRWVARPRSDFFRLAAESRTSVVVGAMSSEPQPPGTYPDVHRYNSAFLFRPEGGEPARYDKINLVLFGEYVPFRYSCYRFYRFLNDGPWNPWGRGGYEYSLTAGRGYTVFPLRARSIPDREFGFGVTICYEDVIPQVFRQFILDSSGSKKAGFMLNISNDGWFGYGTQQAQHLVNCAFRAVENRVSIARSVNTGISGFIRPDGSWHDLVQREGRPLHAGGMGHRTARVMIDPRVTFYSRFGDALPVAWSLVALAGVADAGRESWKKWRGGRGAKRGKRKGAR